MLQSQLSVVKSKSTQADHLQDKVSELTIANERLRVTNARLDQELRLSQAKAKSSSVSWASPISRERTMTVSELEAGDWLDRSYSTSQKARAPLDEQSELPRLVSRIEVALKRFPGSRSLDPGRPIQDRLKTAADEIQRIQVLFDDYQSSIDRLARLSPARGRSSPR
jgi:uncharacterized Zn finger protein